MSIKDLHIDEYVNGFGLKGYNEKGELIINELFDEKLELYTKLSTFFQEQAIVELKLMGQHASHL